MSVLDDAQRPDALATLRAAMKARERYGDLGRRREAFETNMTRYAPPADAVFSREPAIAAEWSRMPDSAADRVILFLHGGGFILGSTATHRHMVAEIGRLARCRTLALDYRLAPEHPFPAAADDALTGYRFLLDAGFAPGKVAIAGDSAGGGLTVSTLAAIRAAGLPQPACAWCMSPWVDLAMEGASITEKADADPFVEAADLRMMAGHYLGAHDPSDPRASPLRADFAGCAPLLIQVGSDEVLLDDAVRLARAVGAAEVRTELQIWPRMIHVWPLFYRELDDGRAALAAAARFIEAAMDQGAVAVASARSTG